MKFRLVLVVLGLAIPGCKCSSDAIRATVKFPANSKSRCTQVVVLGTPEIASAPVDRKQREELRVGIIPTAKMPKSIKIVARGFASTNCASLGQVLEQSDELAVAFSAGTVTQVELTLNTPAATPMDLDADGFVGTAFGGNDCRDDDANIHPGAPEDCLAAIDSNCSGTTGCKDLSCDAKPCEAGGTCAGLACVGANRETDCTDGVDNDQNALIDCADIAQCLNLACAPADKCLVGGACDSAGMCAGGSPRQCNSPPGACFADAGTCIPSDGGCDYVPTPGVMCASADKCLTGSICDTAGVCAGGTAVMCPASSVCRMSSCNPAVGCVAVDLDAGCSTGDLCKVAEVCAAGTCGGGTAAPCLTPPEECRQVPGICSSSDGAL